MKKYVIDGVHGSRKSELLDLLSKKRDIYPLDLDEITKFLIDGEFRKTRNEKRILPYLRNSFLDCQKAIFKIKCEWENDAYKNAAQKNMPVIQAGSSISTLAYMLSESKTDEFDSAAIEKRANENRYDIVFLLKFTPKKMMLPSEYECRIKLENTLLDVYKKFGYDMIGIANDDVDARFAAVLSKVEAERK